MADEKTEVKSGVTVNKEAVFIGDFEFKFQGNLIKQYMEWKDACNGDVTEYEQTAKELMAKHYAFYGQFQKENKYVKSGSVLWCSGGSKLTAFDILHDHGVVQKDGTPIGICTDCKANENIYTFEGCKIPAPAGYPERPVVTVKSQPQATLHKCIPMLNGSWSKTKSSKIKIWDESTGKYADAITTGDFLTCFYGGIISVLEVPNVNNLEFAFGDRARALLKYIELPYPPYSNAYIDYFVMDGDNIKEIYFQYAGDWGITIGWGTYIPTIDGHNYDVTEEGISILKKYGMTDKDISHVNSLITKYKDADKDNRKVYYQEIKNFFQSKKLKVPIADCNKYFEERLAQHENRINKLKNADYSKLKMNQDQFNALVIHRYCRGNIYGDLDDKLKNGGDIIIELFQQPVGYKDRGETEYNIFISGKYEYQGHSF
jgi:hypothetical protein